MSNHEDQQGKVRRKRLLGSAVAPRSDAGRRRCFKSRASGLTLVELLVTIGLITMVSSMFLVAYRAAATEASNIRTQGTIRKINEVLMARMQEYESYPVNFIKDAANPYSLAIPEEATEVIQPPNPEFESKGILVERIRVQILRDIIAQEMPDHVHDIKTIAPIMRRYWTGLIVRRNNNQITQIFTSGAESPRAARLKSRLAQTRADWESVVTNAELLYLIVEDSTLNGSSAIELFGRTEIGDTDNNGFLEFLDAYRRPIRWVRWPTGFPETIRFHPDLLDPSFNNDGFSGNVLGDPIDSRRADPGYRPVAQQTKVYKPSAIAFPLVVSSGPDGTPGVRLEMDTEGFRAEDRYRMRPGSRSVTDVQMPVPYDDRDDTLPLRTDSFPIPFYRLVTTDPWFPRTDRTFEAWCNHQCQGV